MRGILIRVMIREITDKTEWDRLVQASGGHPLQLWGWGEVKERHGWSAHRIELQKQPWVGAQVLIKKLPMRFGSFVYVPRGPVGKADKATLADLAKYSRAFHRAIAVSIEPYTISQGVVKGWSKSKNTVLLARTVVLDLSKSENELLADMSKKTRQYIRKSEKDGVTVRLADRGDLDNCLAIYKQTANRAGFALHDDEYYKDIFNLMADASPVYVAEFDHQIVAFLWLAESDSVAFELYGGVSEVGQSVRANYVLKWQAIIDAKKRNVKEYDLNGLLNDGISDFKRGFSMVETMLTGTYDKALSPLYLIWKYGLPLAKKVVRLIKSGSS